MDLLLATIRLGLAAVFLVAAAGKMLDLAGTRQALVDFGAPRWAATPVAGLLPAAELAVAAGLLLEPTARVGALGALVLLGVFIAAISRKLHAGEAPDCHCFGQFHSAPAGPATLVRNVGLAALAALVAVAVPERAIDAVFAHRSATELALVATSLAAMLLAVACASLWSENRRLLASAEAGPPVAGLPIGEPAPGFSLPDREGRVVTLDDLLARGVPVVLVLVHPGCGPCHELIPHLGRWVASISERVTLVAVSAGAFEADAGELLVLTAVGFEVADAYQLHATPAAVQIGPDGLIVAAPALGPLAVEQLIRVSLGPTSGVDFSRNHVFVSR